MKKFLPVASIIFNLGLAIILFPYLPDLMASHWGVSGQVDGYSTKAFGLFFMPVLSLVLLVIFSYLPKLEPYRKNFVQFKGYFETFMVIIFGFFSYIFALTIFWNLGFKFNMIQLMSPGLSVLFLYTAVLLRKTKMNWFVGIRTPWTMSSSVVWEKTHLIGSKLFALVGILALMGVIVPAYAFYLFFFPLLISIVFIYFYSYFIYVSQKLTRKVKNKV